MRTILCVPGENYPSGDKKVTAKVMLEDGTFHFFSFGEDVRYHRAQWLIPNLLRELKSNKRKKK